MIYAYCMYCIGVVRSSIFWLFLVKVLFFWIPIKSNSGGYFSKSQRETRHTHMYLIMAYIYIWLYMHIYIYIHIYFFFTSRPTEAQSLRPMHLHWLMLEPLCPLHSHVVRTHSIPKNVNNHGTDLFQELIRGFSSAFIYTHIPSASKDLENLGIAGCN